MKILATIVLSSFVVLPTITRAEEPDDSRIIQRILETRAAITHVTGQTNAIFLAFWDFDGTILKGDCSEGLIENDLTRYAGLAQVAIAHGFSQIYPPNSGFERFWNDYTNIDSRVGHWLAYPFIPQMLRGAKAADVLQLSRNYFSTTLSNYLRASSVHIIRELQIGGVESHIVSASGALFIKGASESLRIPLNRIHGIELRIRDGIITEELVYPVPWNGGKRDKIQQVIAETKQEHGGSQVYVLAGFGDNYNTDGPFLEFVARQTLPAGKPLSVFYDNTNAPAEYRGLFYLACHRTTVSGK